MFAYPTRIAEVYKLFEFCFCTDVQLQRESGKDVSLLTTDIHVVVAIVDHQDKPPPHSTPV